MSGAPGVGMAPPQVVMLTNSASCVSRHKGHCEYMYKLNAKLRIRPYPFQPFHHAELSPCLDLLCLIFLSAVSLAFLTDLD